MSTPSWAFFGALNLADRQSRFSSIPVEERLVGKMVCTSVTTTAPDGDRRLPQSRMFSRIDPFNFVKNVGESMRPSRSDFVTSIGHGVVIVITTCGADVGCHPVERHMCSLLRLVFFSSCSFTTMHIPKGFQTNASPSISRRGTQTRCFR